MKTDTITTQQWEAYVLVCAERDKYKKVLEFMSNGELRKERNQYKEFYDAFMEVARLSEMVGPSAEEWQFAQDRMNAAEKVLENVDSLLV